MSKHLTPPPTDGPVSFLVFSKRVWGGQRCSPIASSVRINKSTSSIFSFLSLSFSLFLSLSLSLLKFHFNLMGTEIRWKYGGDVYFLSASLFSLYLFIFCLSFCWMWPDKVSNDLVSVCSRRVFQYWIKCLLRSQANSSVWLIHRLLYFKVFWNSGE